jgi:hypothetical protein
MNLVVLQWCSSGVKVMSPWCYRAVEVVGKYKSVKQGQLVQKGKCGQGSRK